MRTPEKIAAIMAESVRETPSTSIHSRSQQLNISEISLKQIFIQISIGSGAEAN